MSKWQRAATLQSMRMHSCHFSTSNGTSCTTEKISTSLYLSGPLYEEQRSMAASFYQNVFTLACSHANHLSLIYYGKSSTTCTYASMVPAFSFSRTRQTAHNSCKFFQLVPTSCNCFQLSFTCLLLGCTLDLTGCDWL